VGRSLCLRVQYSFASYREKKKRRTRDKSSAIPKAKRVNRKGPGSRNRRVHSQWDGKTISGVCEANWKEGGRLKSIAGNKNRNGLSSNDLCRLTADTKKRSQWTNFFENWGCHGRRENKVIMRGGKLSLSDSTTIVK